MLERDEGCVLDMAGGLSMSDVSRSGPGRDPGPERPKVKQLAVVPPGPGPLGGSDSTSRRGEGPRDPHLTILERILRGERIAAAGDRGGSDERDPVEEEWRAHDRSGPFGQGRRRRN